MNPDVREQLRLANIDATNTAAELAAAEAERDALKAENAYRLRRDEYLTAAIERVRALHSPRDRGAGPECMGCRTKVTFTPYEACPTLAALDGES